MGALATKAMQAALAAIDVSGVGKLAAPMTRGQGVIFTLHNVRPEPALAFEPNRILKITPQFLETAIETVRKAGYDIVSLDEAARRLQAPGPQPRFACFTFDDGYKDNRDYAYPVLKKHGVPFAIYVPTAYPDGQGDLWWLVLENAIRKARRVEVMLDGELRTFDASNDAAKNATFDTIYWSLRARPEAELRAAIKDIAAAAGYDASSLCRDLIMDWDELRAFAEEPLLTIGAHTRRHFAVAKLADEEARDEIAESVARIERELGRPCRHFSFPYGDATSAGPRDFEIAKSLGLATAVTTHKDVLRSKYAMTGLPRVSLNGDFQNASYLSAMLTGLPFLLMDGAAAVKASVRGGIRPQTPPQAGVPTARPGAASI